MSEITNLPESFEILKDYASFRPISEVSLDEGVRLVSQAIAYACENDVQRLLVDVTQLTGFPRPSVVDQYYFVRDWASKAKMRVKVALVVSPEIIDTTKFGGTTASNAGLRGKAFTLESEALAWLLDE